MKRNLPRTRFRRFIRDVYTHTPFTKLVVLLLVLWLLFSTGLYWVEGTVEGGSVSSWPEALYWGPRFLHERYRLPIVITENGMANHDRVEDGAVRQLLSVASDGLEEVGDGPPQGASAVAVHQAHLGMARQEGVVQELVHLGEVLVHRVAQQVQIAAEELGISRTSKTPTVTTISSTAAMGTRTIFSTRISCAPRAGGTVSCFQRMGGQAGCSTSGPRPVSFRPASLTRRKSSLTARIQPVHSG